jgi:hypothetical protein
MWHFHLYRPNISAPEPSLKTTTPRYMYYSTKSACPIMLLIAALQTHEKLTGQRLTRTEVETIFNQFMESRHITPSRPFYFHNADNNLRVMFSKLASKISPPPVILPDTSGSELKGRGAHRVWLGIAEGGAFCPSSCCAVGLPAWDCCGCLVARPHVVTWPCMHWQPCGSTPSWLMVPPKVRQLASWQAVLG